MQKYTCIISCLSIKACLLLAFCSVGISRSWGQLDSIHYIPPAHSRSGSDVEQFLYLSTPETLPFPVTISFLRNIPGSGWVFADAIVMVSNSTPVEFLIGATDYSGFLVSEYELNKALPGRGIIIKGPKKFYANLRVRQGVQAGSLTAKGRAGQGRIFRVAHLINSSSGTTARSNFIGIMATEDNTQVTISGYAPGIAPQNNGKAANDVYYPGNTINFTLNAGESYVLSVYCRNSVPTNSNGLIGSLISSNNPIVVNCGSWWANHPNAGQDIGIDQIAPLEHVGTKYVLVRGAASPNNSSINLETPIVVAHYDGTQVFINGSTIAQYTINAGQYVIIPPTFYTNGQNMYIETNKPVFMYQSLAGGTDTDNAGLNFVPPLSCQIGPSVDNIPKISYIGALSFTGSLFIITHAGCPPVISTTGTIGTLSGPYPVPGNPGYVTYDGVGYTGNLKIISDCPIQVGILGRSGDRGWGGYFSGFDIELVPKVTLQPNTQCPDTLFLQKKYINNGISWYRDGQVFTPPNDSIIPVVLPGDYMAIGRFKTYCGDILADTTYYTVPDIYPKFHTDIQDPLCPDDAGHVSIIPDNSSSIYTALWPNGQTGLTQQLQGGQYIVTVTDNNTGCKQTDVIDITPPVLILNTAPDVQKCSENSVTLYASGNFSSFEWSNNLEGDTITVLQPGVYTVTATDSKGCTVADIVIVSNYPTPDAGVTGDNTVCRGMTATLTAPSGLGYNWSWGDVDTQSIEAEPGDYTLTVTDAKGCTNTGSFSVSELAPPIATLTSDKAKICKPETALLSVSTNYPVDIYLWNIPGPAGAQFEVSDGGYYSVIVEDVEGCRDTASLSLFAHEYEVPVISSRDLSICPGQENTVLKVSVPNVKTFLWLPGQQTEQSIPVGASGTYSVTVWYDYGCSATNTVVVQEHILPQPEILGPSAICDKNSGAFSVTGIYSEYLWSTGAVTPSIQAPGDVYTVTVTDSNGCTGAGSITSAVIPLIYAHLNGPDYLCKDQLGTFAAALQTTTLEGMVWLSASSGSDTAISLTNGKAAWIRSLSNTDTIRIDSIFIPGYGCIFEGLPAEITVEVDEMEIQAVPELFANGYPLKCVDDSNASISAAVHYGYPPFTYTWSTGNTDGSSIYHLGPGIYTVTVTGAKGCTMVAETAVYAPPPLIVEINAAAPKCYGIDNGKIEFKYHSGQGNVRISINNGSGIFSPKNILNLGPGAYLIRVEDEYCQWDTTIVFQELIQKFVEFDDSNNVLIELGDSYLFNTYTNTQIDSITWAPEADLEGHHTINPVATPKSDTWYTLTAVTPEGCRLSDRLWIQVWNPGSVYIPNVFKPSSSGYNDIFSIGAKNGTIKKMSMSIFDRWGELLFQSARIEPNDPTSGWDGRFQGKDSPPGVYVWFLNIEYVDGSQELRHGNVTLVR